MNIIQGGPLKWNGKLPIIYGCNNSRWGIFSWEKWYQDQQFWFSRLFSIAQFVRQCWGPKFPYSAISKLEWMSFQLATVVIRNPINFVNAHFYTSRFLAYRIHIDKVNWASTWSHKMCHTKQTTEPNLLILVSFFSEDTSSTDTSYCIHIFWKVGCSIFIGPPCLMSKHLGKRTYHCLLVPWSCPSCHSRWQKTVYSEKAN